MTYGDLTSLIHFVAMELYKCWTCEKSGHKSPDCPKNKRKRKNINLLEVDDETKEKFLSILNEEESDSSFSSEEETEDEEFLNVAQDSGQQCNCQGAFCHCDRQSVRVLSDDSAEILFATIEHIKDNDARRSYLMELQKLVTKQKEKEVPRNVTPFSMKQIMQRYTDKREEPSINELRAEVNSLQQEVREVKSRLNKIDIDTLAKQFLKDAEVSLKGKEIATSDNEDEDNNSSNQSAPSSPKGIEDADSGADRNCIVEGLIPTKYLQKGTTKLYSDWENMSRPQVRPIAGRQPARSNPSGQTRESGPFAIRPEINHIRPDINRYSVLAQLPPIVHPELPQNSSSKMLVLKNPFQKEQEPSSSSSPSGELRFSQKQTSECYTMKQPAIFAEAVSPAGTKSPSKEKEKFEMISLQVFPILALDKE
ncbi:uncharacterized protein LOC107022152 [Solanum pennellii]|uniref:Uncharacterized protein LOC107022152 n=1 Tax=Solanum pennellii TaxID=28526 RepID=A0ABM1GZU9_SOLPN|nr:uncharacterized protein LOC107022152 [Solanum pennellii]